MSTPRQIQLIVTDTDHLPIAGATAFALTVDRNEPQVVTHAFSSSS